MCVPVRVPVKMRVPARVPVMVSVTVSIWVPVMVPARVSNSRFKIPVLFEMSHRSILYHMRVNVNTNSTT